VQCRSGGDPVLYVSNPEGMDRDMRRLSLDALRDLNELQGRDFRLTDVHGKVVRELLA
jgi:hypothetical protein